LSDLSYSRSEDDLDSTLTRSGRVWKRHRPSLTAADEAASSKKRRSAVEKTIEVIYPFGQGVRKSVRHTTINPMFDIHRSVHGDIFL